MLGNLCIGKYADCHTPERVVPGAKVSTVKPGFCIYPLGSDFSDN
jgi:hypothetical protein